jgi:glycosyltransferase involved in cell wall biosynthesis
LVTIEALACGTPVVATPCGSVPELVEDGATGLLRAAEADLADAVRRAGEFDRVRCRKEPAERFSTKRMVAVYQAVVERRRPRQAA